MTLILAGILIGVIAAGWFGYEHQNATYQQLIEELKADRDLARNEAKVFRGLLFPVLNKSEALGDGVALPTGTAPKATTAQAHDRDVKPVGRRVRRHMPFRTLFNQARKLSNTAQKKTDTLADALAQQKVPIQEKNHV